MRRTLKWLGWIVAAVVALPVLLIVLLLVAGNTEFGRSQIETQTAKLSGDMVRIAGLSGRFPDRLRANRVEIRDDAGVWLTLDDLALDWHPLRLATLTAAVERLEAARIAVARLPVSSSPSSSSSTSYSLPVAVDLRTLHVARVELAEPVIGAASVLSVDGTANVPSLNQGDLALTLRRLDSPGSYDLTAKLDPAGRITGALTAREPAGGLLAQAAALPALGPIAIDATVDGPRDAVGTKLAIDAGPLKARADGTVDLVSNAADLAVTAHAPAMAPRLDLTWQSIALDAQVRGPFAAPIANGTLTIDALAAGGATVRQIAARIRGDAGQVGMHAEATGLRIPGPRPDVLEAAPLVADAAVKLNQPGRPLTLSLRHPLVIADASAVTEGPLRANATAELPDLAPLAAIGGIDLQGRTKLTLAGAQDGDITRFTVDGPVAITGGMVPVPGLIGEGGQLALAGALEGSDVTISRFQLDGRTLAVTANGALRGKTLDLTLATKLADLSVLAATVAGNLAIDGHVAGPLDDFGVTADVRGEVASRGVPRGPVTARLEAQHLPDAPVGRLIATGVLDGSPLDLAVAAKQDAVRGTALTIERAEWKSAHAAGAVTLAPGATLPLGTLDLRMTRLEDLRALTGQPLSGSITAGLTTEEQAGRQVARLKAEARNAGLAGTASVGSATLAATVTDPARAPKVDVKLAVDGAVVSGMRANAKLAVAGPQEALAIRLDGTVLNLQGAPATLATAATLNLPAKQTTLATLQAGWKGETLRLLGPARVEFGNGVAVDRLRLGLRQATVEIAGRATPTLDLTVAVRNVTPDLARIVDPSIAADGTLTADAKLTGTPERPFGTVRLAANGLRMRTGPARSLPAANLTATADLAGDSARIDTRLTAGPMTTLTVTGRAPIKPAGPLDLRANGAVDLALLDPILSANGRRVRGRATLDAIAAGTLDRPRLGGTLQLSGGEVQDIPLGARISGITALVQADGDTVRITRFDGRAGQGTLGLTGTISPTAPGMPVDLHLVAANATPLSGDRMTVTLSADLTVRGQIQQQLQAAGKVTIANAEIRIPERLPASIAVLNVRIAGAPPPPPPGPGPNIGLAVTVEAPRQIFVRGRGIFAELGGKIAIGGTAEKPQPDGAFQLIRGTFSIAGQSLTFSKGEVTFSGGGLADPAIQFVATSSSASITANVEVSGYASNPKIRLYSSPELPQDEVLAQLIFKRSTSSLSPFELAQLAAALASLTGVGGGIGDPLDRVRQALGLDTLSVGGGTGNSGPTLQAGRYVAPGVFVGAKQGTGGASTQGLVQVDLYKGLKLEGTVGTGSNTNPGASPEDSGGSSVGLKYQFEY